MRMRFGAVTLLSMAERAAAMRCHAPPEGCRNVTGEAPNLVDKPARMGEASRQETGTPCVSGSGTCTSTGTAPAEDSRLTTMPLRTLAAWGVHLYTALGAPLGVWAVFAAFEHDFKLAWLLIAVTIFIDSTDGVLARAVRVWDVLPWIDGRRLDDIVDYFGWVIVPAILLVLAGLLPTWMIVAPLLASGYGFAQTQAKTEDDFFLGFPSYWGMIGFYLYVFQTPQWFNVALILFL